MTLYFFLLIHYEKNHPQWMVLRIGFQPTADHIAEKKKCKCIRKGRVFDFVFIRFRQDNDFVKVSAHHVFWRNSDQNSVWPCLPCCLFFKNFFLGKTAVDRKKNIKILIV